MPRRPELRVFAFCRRGAVYTLRWDGTGGTYAGQSVRGDGRAAAARAGSDRGIAVCPGDTATANAFGAFVHVISNPVGVVNDPHSLILSGHHADSDDSQVQVVS